MKLNKSYKTHFNCSGHKWQLCIDQFSLRPTVFPNYRGVLKKNQNKKPTATRIGCYVHYPTLVSIVLNWVNHSARGVSWVHDIEECSSPASARGATLCTIRFCFGNARFLDLSLWYADKLIAQFNGCASSTSQAYAPMRWRRTNISQLPCTQKKMSTLLGGPCHSGAPRLCLPCLPCRDATADRPVHSDTVLGFSGKHSSQAAMSA